MKIVVLVVCFFISCTQAKGFVKDVEPSCYDNCVGFASYLKSRSFKDPVEEARKYCADFKIKVCFAESFHQLHNSLSKVTLFSTPFSFTDNQGSTNCLGFMQLTSILVLSCSYTHPCLASYVMGACCVQVQRDLNPLLIAVASGE